MCNQLTIIYFLRILCGRCLICFEFSLAQDLRLRFSVSDSVKVTLLEKAISANCTNLLRFGRTRTVDLKYSQYVLRPKLSCRNAT